MSHPFSPTLLLLALLTAGCSKSEHKATRQDKPAAKPPLKAQCVTACRHVFALPLLERRTDLSPAARRKAADKMLQRATQLVKHCARTCSA